MWFLVFWLMPAELRRGLVLNGIAALFIVMLILGVVKMLTDDASHWSRPTRVPTAATAAVSKPESPSSGAAAAADRADDGVRATFLVRLPANADLWLQNSKGKQTGPSRRFRTPPLEAGLLYDYELRARWLDGEKVVDQTRHIEVRASSQIEVNFNQPQSSTAPRNNDVRAGEDR